MSASCWLRGSQLRLRGLRLSSGRISLILGFLRLALRPVPSRQVEYLCGNLLKDEDLHRDIVEGDSLRLIRRRLPVQTRPRRPGMLALRNTKTRADRHSCE